MRDRIHTPVRHSPKGLGHPATSDPAYSDNEWEFMKAVHEFKVRTGKQFPTLAEVFRIVMALGYERPQLAV